MNTRNSKTSLENVSDDELLAEVLRRVRDDTGKHIRFRDCLSDSIWSGDLGDAFGVHDALAEGDPSRGYYDLD